MALANWLASSRSGTIDKAVRIGDRRVIGALLPSASWFPPATWNYLDLFLASGAIGVRKSCGMAGPGFASPGLRGMVISGVTITTSSVLFLLMSLLLNRFPSTGKADNPGILATVSVTRLSINPAITKLWPSPSSILVSIRRVDRAGMVKPLNETALAKSSEETSGFTYSRSVLLGVMLGLNVSRMPNSRNWMVTAPELA